MAIVYATFSEFTEVYSVKGITEAQINSYYLPYGALRVNESLGGCFTLPFSSNNHTAKDLSIHFAYLEVLLRTKNQQDSQELRQELLYRVDQIKQNNMPMITDSGEAIFGGAGTTNDAWSSMQDYNPVFDMRDAMDQRIDPDQIDYLFDRDV